MNLQLKDYQTEFSSTIQLLSQVYNLVDSQSKHRLGIPEGTPILNQIYELVMACRVQKPSNQANPSMNEIRAILEDSKDHLNYELDQTKNENTKVKIKELLSQIETQKEKV